MIFQVHPTEIGKAPGNPEVVIVPDETLDRMMLLFSSSLFEGEQDFPVDKEVNTQTEEGLQVSWPLNKGKKIENY